MICKEIHLPFFYKQPGDKQLALEQQIAQHLSYSKKYSLRKSGVFPL